MKQEGHSYWWSIEYTCLQRISLSKAPHKSISKFSLSSLSKLYFSELIIIHCWALLTGQVDTKYTLLFCSTSIDAQPSSLYKKELWIFTCITMVQRPILWCFSTNRAKFRDSQLFTRKVSQMTGFRYFTEISVFSCPFRLYLHGKHNDLSQVPPVSATKKV